MKTIFILCGSIALAAAVWAWRSAQMPSRYGSFAGAPNANVADLIERPKDFLGKTVSVKGTVREQCKSMGCYFFIPLGTKTLRVELEEIAMNAPMRGRPLGAG